MMKITVVCGNGLGSSLMMEMSIKSILKDLAVNADVDHVDLGSAKGTLNAQAVNGKIVSLDNMIDKVAMKEKLSTALRELGAL